MLLSQLPYLEFWSSFHATIFIGFGILCFINSSKAQSFFNLAYPDPTQDSKDNRAVIDAKRAVDVLMLVYGMWDLFMGVALYAATGFGSRQALGCIALAAGCVAVVDGAACKMIVGKGHMNHWGYAPQVLLLGILLLGAWDWVPIDDVSGFVTEQWRKYASGA